jgi:MATE family multidrug resistance protein
VLSLSAGDPATAKLACKVTLALVGCVSGTVALCLAAGRHRWGALFSSDPGVVEGVARLLPIVAG